MEDEFTGTSSRGDCPQRRDLQSTSLRSITDSSDEERPLNVSGLFFLEGMDMAEVKRMPRCTAPRHSWKPMGEPSDVGLRATMTVRRCRHCSLVHKRVECRAPTSGGWVELLPAWKGKVLYAGQWWESGDHC